MSIDLERIKRDLSNIGTPPFTTLAPRWRNHIDVLIAEVERLTKENTVLAGTVVELGGVGALPIEGDVPTRYRTHVKAVKLGEELASWVHDVTDHITHAPEERLEEPLAAFRDYCAKHKLLEQDDEK